MVEQDGLYEKYRVFREPKEAEEHPVAVVATWHENSGYGNSIPGSGYLEEVEGFLFVLKPDSDHHARVAMAAYAESVRREKPLLAADLQMVLATLDTEQYAGAEEG